MHLQYNAVTLGHAHHTLRLFTVTAISSKPPSSDLFHTFSALPILKYSYQMHDPEKQTGRGEKTNIVSDTNSSLRIFWWKYVYQLILGKQTNNPKSCCPKKAHRWKDILDIIGIRSSSYISLTANSELLFWIWHVNLQPNSLQTQADHSTKQHIDVTETPERLIYLWYSKPCSTAKQNLGSQLAVQMSQPFILHLYTAL